MISVTLYQCRKMAKQIEPDAFRGITYRSEDWRYYNYMIVFLYGTLNGIHDPTELSSITKLNKRLIIIACENLTKQGVWKDGVAYVEFENENIWMEVVLCTMVAMGSLVRVDVAEESEVPVVDIFKIQKDRESKPYEFDRSFLTDNYFENKLLNQ